MESVQKYLKITQEEICKAREISHRVRNQLFIVCSLSCSLYSFWAFRMLCENFAQPCEIDGCQISSLILFLAYLIDLTNAMKLSKTQILHVIQLQLAFPWTTQSSSSFLASLNDKKSIKNTKTCQKLIINTCKGP